MIPREPFSLLLPVYAGDRSAFLREAFRSTVDDQSRRPDQVVVVQDGPVPSELERTLEKLIANSPVPVTLAPLGHNKGLAHALDVGLTASEHEIVARMDADDVSMPHRFEIQVPLIENGADIVGSGLLEFGTDPSDVVGRRTPPCDPGEIARYARFHDPFNHPTVVYRRSAVLAAGGYLDLPLMEDYWLFARMIANGVRAQNIAEPLVYYRVGAEAYARRGGMRLLRSELRLQRRFRDERFTTRSQYLRNVVVRGGYRVLPEWLRRAIYRRVIATYGERRGPSRVGQQMSPLAAQPRGREHAPVRVPETRDGSSPEYP